MKFIATLIATVAAVDLGFELPELPVLSDAA